MSDGEKREKIFICVDVDIPRNDRIQALEEPAAGLGLWTALTCYAREQLTAPLVPKRYALSLWGEPRNAKRLADLVRVGLLAETETHYEVLRYAPRNQTKEMVEKSRESARIRAAKSRDKRRVGNANGADESRVTHANEAVSETNGCANASFYSSSSDDPADHEREPEGVQGEASATPPPSRFVVDEQLRMRCIESGARVPTNEDIALAMSTAKDRGRMSHDWRAYVVSWMLRQKRFDAKIVESAKDAPKPPAFAMFRAEDQK